MTRDNLLPMRDDKPYRPTTDEALLQEAARAIKVLLRDESCTSIEARSACNDTLLRIQKRLGINYE